MGIPSLVPSSGIPWYSGWWPRRDENRRLLSRSMAREMAKDWLQGTLKKQRPIFQGKIFGKSLWFPVDFPINYSIDKTCLVIWMCLMDSYGSSKILRKSLVIGFAIRTHQGLEVWRWCAFSMLALGLFHFGGTLSIVNYHGLKLFSLPYCWKPPQ